jgi:hypothetical protein
MAVSTTESDSKPITGTSVTFDYTLVPGAQYRLSGDTNLWYRISSGATAAVVGADENHYLAAGAVAAISAKGSANRVTAIKNTGASDGNASLSLVQGTGA